MSIYDNEFISGDKVNRPGMGEFYRGSHIKLTEPTRKQKQARGYNSFQGKKNIVGKPVHLPDTTKVHKEWKPIVGPKASRTERLAQTPSTRQPKTAPNPVQRKPIVEDFAEWKAKTAPIPVTTSTPQRSVELTLSEKKTRTIIFILFYIYLCYLFRNTGLAWHRL